MATLQMECKTLLFSNSSWNNVKRRKCWGKDFESSSSAWSVVAQMAIGDKTNASLKNLNQSCLPKNPEHQPTKPTQTAHLPSLLLYPTTASSSFRSPSWKQHTLPHSVNQIPLFHSIAVILCNEDLIMSKQGTQLQSSSQNLLQKLFLNHLNWEFEVWAIHSPCPYSHSKLLSVSKTKRLTAFKEWEGSQSFAHNINSSASSIQHSKRIDYRPV